jgi:hypothetical protein
LILISRYRRFEHLIATFVEVVFDEELSERFIPVRRVGRWSKLVLGNAGNGVLEVGFL